MLILSLSPRRTISLPLELEFLVIDQFQGDTPRLRILCWICRSWARHAQSLLFSNINVEGKTSAALLTLLKRRSHLAGYITALHITPVSRNPPELLSQLIMLGRLPNLNAVDVAHNYFRGGSDPLDVTVWAAISRLRLHNCKFETIEMMFEFIASFPRLGFLNVSYCDTQTSARVLHREIPMPSWRLKHLELTPFPALISWMVHQPVKLVVQSFRIVSLGADASAINALLSKIGGSLRNLELPWMYSPDAQMSEHPELISLRPCAVLTTVTFGERNTYYLGRGVITILSHIASPLLLLSTVSFEIRLDQGYLDIPWEEVEAVLMAHCLSTLSVVVVKISSGSFQYSVVTPYERAV
ncbi:hypothetical protein B0H16DRAFT_1889665 [Mycena metata]|uniref:F-box domain-containing protein n=1 Tax=Mycena metata TaxID=1033252 RepID=A0AAD7N4S7_9AGAR|nr:hypothetical protein B0H16DRAFT_1889665 [Mycena metata]